MGRFLLELQASPHCHGVLSRRFPTAFDDYTQAHQQSQADADKAAKEADAGMEDALKDTSESSKELGMKIGREQSGEDDAMKVNAIGTDDKAKCKDGCRLGDGAGLAIGPPPEEDFSGATGSGSAGVAFPGQSGASGQGQGVAGQGGSGQGVAGGGAGAFGAGAYAGEAEVPQEWLDADAAKEADERAVELVAKEAQRSHRSFEDVANMDTDNPADDPYASLPRDPYRGGTLFKDEAGHTLAVGWPPAGASDKWGGPPIQLPVNLASGTMLSGTNWTSFLLAFMGPSQLRPVDLSSSLLRSTFRSHRHQGVLASFAEPSNDQDDDLDDDPEEFKSIYDEEPPPPGARDKFGGPAMQQPDDIDAPSAEGSTRAHEFMVSLCPNLRRRKRMIDFL